MALRMEEEEKEITNSDFDNIFDIDPRSSGNTFESVYIYSTSGSTLHVTCFIVKSLLTQWISIGNITVNYSISVWFESFRIDLVWFNSRIAKNPLSLF